MRVAFNRVFTSETKKALGRDPPNRLHIAEFSFKRVAYIRVILYHIHKTHNKMSDYNTRWSTQNRIRPKIKYQITISDGPHKTDATSHFAIVFLLQFEEISFE